MATTFDPNDPKQTGPGGGLLGNGSTFVMPNFSAMPWFHYAGLKDQMIDAQRGWASGDKFANNIAGRYNFKNQAANLGGNTLGMNAYRGGLRPPGGPPPGGPPGGGYVPPNPGGGIGGGGGSGPGGPPPPAPGGLPPGLLAPPRPPGGPPPFPGAPPPVTAAPPPIGAPPPGGPPPAPVGVPFPGFGGNFGTPPPANNTPTNASLAASGLPPQIAQLLANLGGNQGAANQMTNAYNVGGQNYNPQTSADAQRGQSGGISALMPGIKSLYESMGIIKNGAWAKKQDASGQWIPV